MNRFAVLTALFLACSPVKGTPLIDAEVIDLESVQVSPTTIMGSAGFTAPTQLSVKAMFSTGDTKDVTPYVTWTTSDATVATVDATGIVTVLASGNATITATLDGMSGSASVTTTEPMIAVDSTTDSGIDFFPANATGDTPPVRSIRGALTNLTFTWSMAVDANELYVTNGDSQCTVNVFPLDGSGSGAPARTLVGVGLASAYGIQVFNGEIYTGQIAGGIAVFPETGSGNIAPSRQITGSATELSGTVGITIFNNLIIAANNTGPSVTMYPVDGSGNIAPTQMIAGSNTHLLEPVGVMVYDNELYVSDYSANSIFVFPVTATGNVAPTRWIHGPDFSPACSLPTDMVVLGGNLVATCIEPNVVATMPLQSTGDTTPTTLTGSATNIISPRGIVLF